jgi:ABC-type glycerol-3-phosphate transport system permease component
MTDRLFRALLLTLASLIAIVFVYPFYWMLVSAFRTQEAILSAPLRLIPESLNFSAFQTIATIGGVPLWRYAVNSITITIAATVVGVCATGLGAYALYRNPRLPLFTSVRYSFLLTIMYPHMLLVIPLYFVSHQLGLLNTYWGVILVMSLVPLVFFIFVQFFRSIPHEMIDAARVDGASEWQILTMVVLPIARPVIMTAVLIAFLLNWKQWFPILVLSSDPRHAHAAGRAYLVEQRVRHQLPGHHGTRNAHRGSRGRSLPADSTPGAERIHGWGGQGVSYGD